MVNINGKEWSKLEASDIQSALSDHDFGESFYFESSTMASLSLPIW